MKNVRQSEVGIIALAAVNALQIVTHFYLAVAGYLVGNRFEGHPSQYPLHVSFVWCVFFFPPP